MYVFSFGFATLSKKISHIHSEEFKFITPACPGTLQIKVSEVADYSKNVRALCRFKLRKLLVIAKKISHAWW